MEPWLTMIVGAIQPMGEKVAIDTGYDAGQKIRDVVADSENTLDDSALEILKAGLRAMLEGIDSPASPE